MNSERRELLSGWKELQEIDSRIDRLSSRETEVRSQRAFKGLHLTEFIDAAIGIDSPKFQREWDYYLERWDEYPNLLIEAARGHGKSERITHAWPTWLIVNNPNIRGLIISYSAMQAQASLRAVSESLTHLGLKPQHPTKWTQTELIVDRNKAGKDPTLKAAGIDTFITGSHVDFIVLDDAIVAENSATEDQRTKFREWYNATLTHILNPSARIVFCGTRWRPQDFHGEIEEKYSDKPPPEGLGKGKGFKVLKYPVYNSDGSLLWPERWTEEEVQKRRDSDTEGGIFFECLPPNEIVTCASSVKQVKDLRQGDRVLTTNGTYENINTIKSFHADKLVKITPFGGIATTLTPNHRVWAYHPTTSLPKDYEAINPTWIEAGELKHGDFLFFPIQKEHITYGELFNLMPDLSNIKRQDHRCYRTVNDAKYHLSKDYCLIDRFWYLVGLWVADGAYNPSNYAITICLNNLKARDVKIGEWLKQFIEETFKCHVGSRVQNNCLSLTFSNKQLGEFLKGIFGGDATNKHITEFVERLPRSLLLHFFNGYIDGDGFENKEMIGATSVSRSLIEGIQRIAFSLGMPALITSPCCDKHNWYQLRINLNRKTELVEVFPDYVRSRVRKTELMDYDGIVYDIGVENHHSFTSGMLTLHNSQMMLNPRGMLGQRFKEEWITNNFYDKLPTGLRYFTAYDLATGKGKDRFAGCVGALDNDNNLFVVDFTLKDITFPEQVQEVKRMYDRYPSIKVAIESSQYQIALSQQLIHETNLPIYPVNPVGHKEDRITMMTPSLQNGKIRFPTSSQTHEWYKSFMGEYLSFPRSDVHDDMLDALYYVWMMSNVRRRSVKPEVHFDFADAVGDEIQIAGFSK